MSGKKIRNILNKQIGKQLNKSKLRVREEAQKNISKVKERIPTKETIQKKLMSDSCSLKAQERVTKIYEKLYNTLDSLEKLMYRGIEKFESIQLKIKQILDKYLPAIEVILRLIRDVIIPALIIIEIVTQIALAIPAKYLTGTLIGKLIERKKDAREKRKQNQAESKGFLKCIPIYMEKAMKILTIIIATVTTYKLIYGTIQKLKLFCVFLYTQYIKKCNVKNEDDDNDGNINTSGLEQNILDLIDDNTSGLGDAVGITDKMTTLYNDLIQELNDAGKTKVVERIANLNERGQLSYSTSYKVVNVSTTTGKIVP